MNDELTRALDVADRMIAAHPESDIGPQVKIQVEWALQPRSGRWTGRPRVRRDTPPTAGRWH